MTDTDDYLARLGLSPDADERAIRRAYARELKQIDQEADAAGFQTLREAYEAALYWQRYSAQHQTATEAATEATIASAREAAALDVAAPPLEHGLPPAADAAPPPQDDQRPLAAAVFDVFAQRVVALGATAAVIGDDGPWQQALRASLDDPRLINIVARELFEQQVAELLAQGWRPGHEMLLDAAVAVFGWAADRRRVHALGQAGATLDAAIDEQAMFEAQASPYLQRPLIKRLRDPRPPSARELVADTVAMEMLVTRFPTWLRLTTSVDNILRWRELDRALPGWKRMLTFTGWSKPSLDGPNPGWRLNWKWLALIAVLFVFRIVSNEGGKDEASRRLDQAAGRPSSGAYENVTYLLHKADQLYDAADYDGAIAGYTRVIQLDPKRSFAYSSRALASIFTNANDDGIISDLDKAGQLDPDNENVPRARGLLALRQERPGNAIAEFTRALELLPDHAYTLDKRAQAYTENGQFELALADIAHRLKVTSENSVAAYRLRILIHFKQADQAGGLEQIETMIGANKHNPDAYSFGAHIYGVVDQQRQAMSLINRGIDEAPNSTLYLARAKMRERADIAGRRADIERSVALSHGGNQQLSQRIDLELDDGKPEAALKIIAAEIDRGDTIYAYQPTLLAYRAIIYARMGNQQQAGEALKAARAAAGTRLALNNLAWFLATRNTALPQALSAVDAALAKQANSAAYLDTKGLILLRMGRHRDAVAAYDAALKLYPAQAMSLFGRGIAKRRAGDDAGGKADMQAARFGYPGIDLEFAGFGITP